MTSAARKHRRAVGGATRDSSATRRAPLAVATPLEVAELDAVSRLVRAELKREKKVKGASRYLADTRHHLRSTGRGHLVEAVLGLRADGGRLLRVVARACPDMREAAASAALWFVRTTAEHQVESASALALLARAALESAVADAALERLIVGTGTADDARVAEKVGAASRIDTQTALAFERVSRIRIPIHMRIKPDLLEKVDEMAAREGITRTAMVEQLIEHAPMPRIKTKR